MPCRDRPRGLWGAPPRLLAALAALAVLAACSPTHMSGDSTALPATLEHVPSSDHPRIHLTQRAADRLGIQVAPVTDAQVASRPGTAAVTRTSVASTPATTATPAAAAATPVAGHEGDATKPATPAAAPPAAATPAAAAAPSTTLRRVIPFNAVLYEPNGSPFTYTNPQLLVYVRLPLTIDYVVGDVAVLKDGPAAGTPVVTVGGTELLGIEFGVGVGL